MEKQKSMNKYIDMIIRFDENIDLELQHPEFYNLSKSLRERDKKVVADVELLSQLSFGLKNGSVLLVKKSERHIEDILKDFKDNFGFEVKEITDNKLILIHEKEELFVNLKEKNFFKEGQNGNSLIVKLGELELINEIFEMKKNNSSEMGREKKMEKRAEKWKEKLQK